MPSICDSPWLQMAHLQFAKANRINSEFKEKNPKIEWNRLRGFRNRIIHDYFGIDYEIEWEIIETYLNKLTILLESVIRDKKFGNNDFS